MKVHSVDGREFEISAEEIKRVAGMHGSTAEHQNSTAAIMHAAQKELREATGDFPETLEELYEFAAVHRLFGNRTYTHIMCNFLKVFFCMMAEKTAE
jgi:hypothetical protein